MRAESLEIELLEHFVVHHPDDAGRVLETMAPGEAADVLGALAPEQTASLLGFVPPFRAATALAHLEVDAAARHVSAARDDVGAAILRATAQTRRRNVLEALEPARRSVLERLLRYPEGTAGSLLDPRVLTVPEGLTVGEALERVRSEPEQSLYYVYVVGGEHELRSVVTLRELMLAEPEAPIASIATTSVSTLRAEAGRDAILADPGWRRVPTLPVVDARGRLLGVVRYESVRELEQTAGAEALRDPTPRTAAAVGELYGVGMRGMLALGRSLLGHEPRGGDS